MKESKHKICKMPGCEKETYDSKSLFCGEHKRALRELIKKVGPVGMAALAFIAKSSMSKKS